MFIRFERIFTLGLLASRRPPIPLSNFIGSGAERRPGISPKPVVGLARLLKNENRPDRVLQKNS
jgi:hypothetical protein